MAACSVECRARHRGTSICCVIILVGVPLADHDHHDDGDALYKGVHCTRPCDGEGPGDLGSCEGTASAGSR